MNNDKELFNNYLNHESHVSPWDRFAFNLYSNLLGSIGDYEKSVSIIIQGPLNERSIKTIPDYLKYGEVIVSCWDDDDTGKLDLYKGKIKLVVNKYSDLPKFRKRSGKQAPWIYQHATTLSGINEASGSFCIKLRSDESFPVLDPLVNLLIRNSKKDWFKIITSNIYFRFDKQHKFHPSDHIVAGSRIRMKDAFERAYSLCEGKTQFGFPEQLLCNAIIETYFDKQRKKFDSSSQEPSSSLMKKHFDIIRIRNLPRHIWTSSYRRYDALYNEEDWCNHIDLINS